jgi:hypothetical protein
LLLLGVVFAIQSWHSGLHLGGDEHLRVIMQSYAGASLLLSAGVLFAALVVPVGGLQEGRETHVAVAFILPGIVYALGMRSPGLPWFLGGYRAAKRAAEFVLGLVPREILNESLILRMGSEEYVLDLAKVGLDFPSKYRQRAQLQWPATDKRATVWRPHRAAHGGK